MHGNDLAVKLSCDLHASDVTEVDSPIVRDKVYR